MRLRAAIACVLLALAPAAASAAVFPGTAEFATPERGQAVIAPGVASLGASYVPYTGTRTFTFFARMPRSVGRFPVTAYVRHKAARGKCARSFAADRGTALTFPVAVPDARGFIALMSREVRWPRPGRHRFCIWLTRRPRTTVIPVTQIVRFVDDATGGVQLGWSDPDGTHGIATHVASTDPYTLSSATTGCPPDIARDYGVLDRVQILNELIEFTSFDFASRPCVNTVNFSVTGSAAGAFGLTMDEARAAQGAVARGGDACVLPALNETPGAARELLRIQGCRLGRVVRAPKTSTPPGRVWAYVVDGAPAHLVPPGTRVDVVVTPG